MPSSFTPLAAVSKFRRDFAAEAQNSHQTLSALALPHTAPTISVPITLSPSSPLFCFVSACLCQKNVTVHLEAHSELNFLFFRPRNIINLMPLTTPFPLLFLLLLFPLLLLLLLLFLLSSLKGKILTYLLTYSMVQSPS